MIDLLFNTIQIKGNYVINLEIDIHQNLVNI